MSTSRQSLQESIREFHALLNRPDLVPPRCYRRNMVVYTLISYVNNIIGLYLSDNFEVIPVFVDRAAKHMEEFPVASESTQYYRAVQDYLVCITNFTISQGASIDTIRDQIPLHIYNAAQNND